MRISRTIWFGLTLAAWLRLLRRHRFAVARRHRATAVLITLFTGVNSVLALAQKIVFGRRIAREPIPPPVFVIGHWRSGTTFLHELLATDPRFVFPNTLECFCPAHFMVSGGLFTRLRLPQRRLIDDMPLGWGRPQEDEWALLALGAGSPYEMIGFPADGLPAEADLRPNERDAAARGRWEDSLTGFLRSVSLQRRRQHTRQAAAQAGPHWTLLKSPTHTARIAELARLFPSARFVHLTRDPRELYASGIRLWASLFEVHALGPVERHRPGATVAGLLAALYRDFGAARDALPPGRFIEIRFADLVADPVACLRHVFAQLELGSPAPDPVRLADLLAWHRAHTLPAHPPRLLDEAVQLPAIAAYAAEFGYDLTRPPGDG